MSDSATVSEFVASANSSIKCLAYSAINSSVYVVLSSGRMVICNADVTSSRSPVRTECHGNGRPIHCITVRTLDSGSVDCFLNHPLTILNNKQHTYIHPATGSSLAIDLTFVTPSLSLNHTWKPLDDLHGSDRLPILLSSNNSFPDEKLPHKANWTFQTQCNNLLTETTPVDNQDSVLFFTYTLISIAFAINSIPNTSTKNTKPNKPWINDV